MAEIKVGRLRQNLLDRKVTERLIAHYFQVHRQILDAAVARKAPLIAARLEINPETGKVDEGSMFRELRAFRDRGRNLAE